MVYFNIVSFPLLLRKHKEIFFSVYSGDLVKLLEGSHNNYCKSLYDWILLGFLTLRLILPLGLWQFINCGSGFPTFQGWFPFPSLCSGKRRLPVFVCLSLLSENSSFTPCPPCSYRSKKNGAIDFQSVQFCLLGQSGEFQAPYVQNLL